MPPRLGNAALAMAMIGALGIRGGFGMGDDGFSPSRYYSRRSSRGHRGSNHPRRQIDDKVRARRQEAKKARRVNRQNGKQK